MDSKPLGFQIKKTSLSITNYIDRAIRRELSLPLSSSEGLILNFLYAHSDQIVSSKMLLKKFKVSKSTMSQTLNGLFKKGYLNYEEVEEDGRVKRIILTDSGRLLEEKVAKILDMADVSIKKGLSKNEIIALESILKKIRHNVGFIGDLEDWR